MSKLDYPDQTLLSLPQYKAIEEIFETYKRVKKPISMYEAFYIWIQRGCPLIEETK